MSKWIKNFDELAVTPLRSDALNIIESGLDAVNTKFVIHSDIKWNESSKTLCVQEKNICFSDFEKIYFVGIGKCAVDAGLTIEEMLGDNLTSGIVLDVREGSFKKIKSLVGTHPLPSGKNINATQQIVDLLTGATEKDLVIAVISGGGSALLCSPFEISCESLAEITSALTKKGADIYELNTVRKHLSQVQGGNLAKISYPATVIGLIFSDVLGDDISVIASGPLTKDETSKEDAEKILIKYGIREVCALSNFEVLETPKEDKYFRTVSTFVLASNKRALLAMRQKAEELGYSASIENTELQGEAREVGKNLVSQTLKSKSVYLYGGETTVTISGSGIGGRNQELALGALNSIPDNALLISFASDGRDNSDVAGAVADDLSKKRAKEKGLEADSFLKDNNSYVFWRNVESQIKTGITGINISDLIISLIE